MYCVKCGVRLQEGVERCPLCRTPVWNPETPVEPKKTFSDLYPTPPKSSRYPVLTFLTLFLAALCLSMLILCLRRYGRVSWSGYVMLGCALVYFSVIFPFWFEKRHPMIFVPLAFVLTCGYLLYICLYNHGKWFLSFAFPLVMIAGLIVTGSVALFRYVRHRRMLNTGILLVVIGCTAMLVELFQCITFHTKMFTWSLYCVCGFSVFGLFLILSALIRPWCDFLRRKLFI